MSKIAFVADVHLANHRIQGGASEAGINERARTTLDALATAYQIAVREGCEWFVILGDLFDHERPSPQLIAATIKALRGPVQVAAIVGNHDQASAVPGDHALAPLNFHELAMTVVDGVDPVGIPAGGGAVLGLVPFQPGPGAEWLPTSADTLALDHDVVALGFHLGVYDPSQLDSVWWAKEADDAVTTEVLAGIAESTGVTRMFCGNWHGRYQWEVGDLLITQIGALVPTGWDNPGLDGYGGVAIYDTDTGSVEFEEVAGPRFVMVNSSEELPAISAKAAEAGHRLYVRWTVPPEELTSAGQVLQHATSTGMIAAYDVQVDRGVAKESAHRAAQEARSEEGLDAAITRYVQGLALPPTIDPVRLTNLVRRYL